MSESFKINDVLLLIYVEVFLVTPTLQSGQGYFYFIFFEFMNLGGMLNSHPGSASIRKVILYWLSHNESILQRGVYGKLTLLAKCSISDSWSILYMQLGLLMFHCIFLLWHWYSFSNFY